MKIEDVIQYWIDTAENDLKAVESIYETGHYDWALFIGHLVLEKILKAHWVKFIQDSNVPKTHNLVRLAHQANLAITEEQESYLGTVMSFHLEARYPEYKKEFYKLASKQFATDNLIKIKEMYSWLKQNLI